MHTTPQAGFTLAEILIAIVIIGIVAAFATITYNRVFGAVNLEEVQQRAELVELFVKQLEILDVPANEVAERINSNPDFRDTSLAEKVIGSYRYMREHVAKGTDLCNPPSGVVAHVTGKPIGPIYTFLNILDGPNKTPVTANRARGTIIQPVSKTSDSVYCFSRNVSGQLTLAVRVDDDNNWWCIRHTDDIDGPNYFSTVAASGQLRIICPYKRGPRGNQNAKTNALLEDVLDDNFGT